jgi:hypothetical protein
MFARLSARSFVCVVLGATLAHAQTGKGKTISTPGKVKFTEYKENGIWKTSKNDHFSIRTPERWKVSLKQRTSGEKEDKNRWTYILKNDNNKTVFEILIIRGGPQWIRCFCAPQAQYQFSDIDGYRIWLLTQSIRVAEDGFLGRTVKVASEQYRLDIHALVKGEDWQRIFHVAETARPLN